jgi:hypothetical protein
MVVVDFAALYPPYIVKLGFIEFIGLTGFFGFKAYPINLSESEFTELKNFQNGSRGFLFC